MKVIVLVFVVLTTTLLVPDASGQALPSAPQSLSALAVPATSNVKFDWQAPLSGEVQSYQLEIGRSPGASDAGTVAVGNVLTYTLGVPPGGYFARVRARNASGVGPASNEASFVVTCGQTEVAAPAALTYRWVTVDRLELTWMEPAGFLEGLVGYRVEIGSAPGTFFQAVDVGLSATWFSFDISALPVRAPVYYVRVRTVTSCSPSLASNEVAVAWPPAPLPPSVVIQEFGPFLELRNRSNATVDLSGWRIHMSLFAANRTYLRKVIDPGVLLNSGCSYLLAPQDGYAFPSVPPDATMAETDADGIALVGRDGVIVDQVGRRPRAGRPASPYFEGSRIDSDADTVPLGAVISYTRRPAATDSDNNLADFLLQAPPTPEGRSSCSPAPGPPRELSFTVVGTTVTLLWSAPIEGTALQAYVIEAGRAPGDASLARFVTSADQTSAVVVGVPFGAYYVRVRGAGALGTGAPSNEVVITVCGQVSCQAPPAAPRLLTAVIDGTTVILNWLPPVAAAATSFVLEAGSVTGSANLAVFEVTAATTGLAVPAVPPGTYFVRVRARGAGGLGPASNEIVVRMP